MSHRCLLLPLDGGEVKWIHSPCWLEVWGHATTYQDTLVVNYGHSMFGEGDWQLEIDREPGIRYWIILLDGLNHSVIMQTTHRIDILIVQSHAIEERAWFIHSTHILPAVVMDWVFFTGGQSDGDLVGEIFMTETTYRINCIIQVNHAVTVTLEKHILSLHWFGQGFGRNFEEHWTRISVVNEATSWKVDSSLISICFIEWSCTSSHIFKSSVITWSMIKCLKLPGHVSNVKN